MYVSSLRPEDATTGNKELFADLTGQNLPPSQGSRAPTDDFRLKVGQKNAD
jgi:hypothetical protein